MAFYFDNIVNNVLSTALDSGQSREFTGEFYCIDGHLLSGETVGDATIEAKIAGGSYQDIETGTIDLSTWAGTRQALVLKFTAGTIVLDPDVPFLTRTFRLRTGLPLVPADALLNDDGDPILNDDEDYIEV